MSPFWPDGPEPPLRCRRFAYGYALDGSEFLCYLVWPQRDSGWLCLIHDAYGPELREAINSADPIRSFRDHDQTMRSKRLFHLLQQNFTGYSKIENLIKSQISALGITESNGFELLRLIRKEFLYFQDLKA